MASSVRSARGAIPDPRIAVRRSGAQRCVLFNAALCRRHHLDRFRYVFVAVSGREVTFRFSRARLDGEERAFALQRDGGEGQVKSTAARVTYLSARRFPEIVPGLYAPRARGRTRLELTIDCDADRPVEVMVERILSRWDAEQIWLFGSRARGDARPTSDWDLLVVVPDSTAQAVVDDPLATWDLRDIEGHRTDIVLCHARDFAMYREVANTLAYESSHHGELIHAA
jgi:predicted nucleotidyltransferase